MKRTFILLFAALISLSGFAQGKRVMQLSSKADGLKLKSVSTEQFSAEQSIKELSFENIVDNNGEFSILEIKDATNPSNVGQANLPVISKLIEVPIGAEIEVDIKYYKEEIIYLNDYGINRIKPTQPSYSKSTTEDEIKFVIDGDYYNNNSFEETPLVITEISGIMRGVQLGRIEIRPYHYNPVENILIVYNDLDFEVKFKNADIATTKNLKSKYYMPEFERSFNSMINYSQSNGSKDSFSNFSKPLKYVIVSNRAFETTLQPFVEWKTMQGYNVIEAYTDVIGTTTTAIKSYLQGLYNAATLEDPAPLYLLIVGDHNGNYNVPAFAGTTGSHITDLYYVTYDGSSDNIPDMYFGRMSANSVTELQNILNKIIPYEKYEFPDDAFLDKAMLIAGVDSYWAPSHGDATISYATRYFYNTAHDYSDIYAYYYGNNSQFEYNVMSSNSSGAAADIKTKISAGLGFANYTAHCNWDGWSSPSISNNDIANWNNVNKYPFMIGNCCLSLEFDRSDSFGEMVLYAENKGAIGYIGGSNSTYWDEDVYWGIGLTNLSISTGNVLNHNITNTGLGVYDAIWHEHNEPYSDWYISGGEMIFCGNLTVQASTSSLKKYYWEIYHLSGDPSLVPYNTIPDDLVLDFEEPTEYDTELTVTTEPYTYVAISQNGALLDAKWSGTETSVTLSFPDLTSDNIFIVGTKQDRKPSINELTPNPPYPPTASFLADKTEIILGDTINFTNESEYAKTYLWNFGDEVTSTEINTSHIYLVEGTYTVSLEATNSIGVDTDTKEIIVNPNTNPPAVNFTADINRLDAGTTVHFTDLSINFPVSWEWEFEGGTPATSTEQNPVVVYSEPGTYNVSLTTSNQYGESTLARTGNIVVNHSPITMKGGEISTVCGTVFMDPGGEGTYANNLDVVHTMYSGTPGAQLVVTFSMLDIETSSKKCVDYLEVYNGESIDAELIGVYCGDDYTVIGENGMIKASNTAGALTFRFVSDKTARKGGWIADVSCYFHNDIPVVGFEVDDAISCDGIVNFADKSLYAHTWSWDFGDGEISTEKNPMHTYSEPGIYTVSLIVTNDHGYAEKEEIGYINYTGSPEISYEIVSASGEQIPDGQITVTIKGGQPPYTIIWNDFPEISSEQITGLLPGTYEVTVIDNMNCSNTQFITIDYTSSVKQEEIEFSVIPNPAKDNVTAKFGNKIPAKIELVNISGKVLYKAATLDNEANINVSMYPSGIYFIVLYFDGNVKSHKLIVTD